MTDYDVIIAGGGMVGASLAHALGRAGLRVAVVEAVPHDAAAQPSFDDRAIALAYGTRRILEDLGVWSALAPDAEPIREVHVSDRGHFGFTHLDARDEDIEALGYVATARDLGRALLAPMGEGGGVKADLPEYGLVGRAFGRQADESGGVIDLICPARVADFTVEAGCVRVAVAPVGASPVGAPSTARSVGSAEDLESRVVGASPVGAPTTARSVGSTEDLESRVGGASLVGAPSTARSVGSTEDLESRVGGASPVGAPSTARCSEAAVRREPEPPFAPSSPPVARVSRGGPGTLTAALLVAADGGRSAIRERLGIAQRHHLYGHHAVVANVTPSLPHRGVAYERFTDSGPLALLPMTGGRCGLVWTVRDADLADVLALDDRAFLAALQERFGFRLGRFTAVGRRSHYPLELRLAQTQVLERIAIIGNAAHTVHPIAGQGFNLGIRDVAALADVLVDAHRTGRDLGSLDVLQPYADARRRDHRNVAFATDTLARLFVNPLAPLRLARNLGMLALDALPPLRHRLARAAMGLSAGVLSTGVRPLWISGTGRWRSSVAGWSARRSVVRSASSVSASP